MSDEIIAALTRSCGQLGAVQKLMGAAADTIEAQQSHIAALEARVRELEKEENRLSRALAGSDEEYR